MSLKTLRVTVDGQSYDVVVEEMDRPAGQDAGRAQAPVVSASTSGGAVAAPVAAVPPPAPVGEGGLASPLAGRVISIDCAPGQQVAAGDKVITLEAMKMHTVVSADRDGKVGVIHVAVGQAVEEGQALLTIE